MLLEIGGSGLERNPPAGLSKMAVPGLLSLGGTAKTSGERNSSGVF
jgi:hypothetical protein